MKNEHKASIWVMVVSAIIVILCVVLGTIYGARAHTVDCTKVRATVEKYGQAEAEKLAVSMYGATKVELVRGRKCIKKSVETDVNNVAMLPVWHRHRHRH